MADSRPLGGCDGTKTSLDPATIAVRETSQAVSNGQTPRVSSTLIALSDYETPATLKLLLDTQAQGVIDVVRPMPDVWLHLHARHGRGTPWRRTRVSVASRPSCPCNRDGPTADRFHHR